MVLDKHDGGYIFMLGRYVERNMRESVRSTKVSVLASVSLNYFCCKEPCEIKYKVQIKSFLGPLSFYHINIHISIHCKDMANLLDWLHHKPFVS